MSYRQEHRTTPMFEARATALRDTNAAVNDPIVDERSPSSRYRRPDRKRGRMGGGALVAISVATHVIGASLLYSHLVRVLYSLIENTPRLAPFERGLVRLLAVSVYLPPFAPTVLLIVVALWVGAARKDQRVAHALSYGALALAFDSVLRVIGVWLAEPPANVGELLDLPARFSPGPRMLAELSGIPVVGSGAIYWSVVCSLAAFVAVLCVSRALLFAEDAAADAVERRRRRARGGSIETMQYALVSVLAFAVIAFLGQLALPVATQLFLRMFA
jgi:hypothetical protein